MDNTVTMQTSKRLIPFALDAGDSAAFSSIFLASSFSCSHMCLWHSAGKQNPRPPQRQ